MTNNELIISLIGVSGVIIGVLITTVVNWRLKTKEVRLRLLEKIFDKRLLAHENILEVSKYLRTTINTNQVEQEIHIITYAAFLNNKEAFEDLKGKIYLLTNFNTHWLDIEIFRELNYIQDYIGSVGLSIKDIPEEYYPEVGKVLKDDFLSLASSLEELTLKFFDKDIYKIKIDTKRKHHKYPKEVTMNRLENMNLSKRRQEIAKYKVII